VSVCVQALESLHPVPFALFGFEQTPVPVLQMPTSWHWSRAVQTTAVPDWQTPDWHASPVVQAFPSLQDTPLGFTAPIVQFPESRSQNPGSWHGSIGVQTTGSPAQVPIVHTSDVVQFWPSEQALPWGHSPAQ
jgi:hypothetical protein